MNSTNTFLRWGAAVLGCLSLFVLATIGDQRGSARHL